MKQSPLVRGIIIGIGAVVAILVIFQAGVFVGYHKANFSKGLGDNYFKAFGGEHVGGHGVTGKIIKINPSDMVVEGMNNVEETISIDAETMVRRLRDTASTTALKIGDSVVVIGAPDQNGVISAKLIRIIPQLPK